MAASIPTLYLLAFLACPIGMGVMMWFMARGMRGHGRDTVVGEDGPLATAQGHTGGLAEKIESLAETTDHPRSPGPRAGPSGR